MFVLPHSPLAAWGCKLLHLPTGVRILMKDFCFFGFLKQTKNFHQEELRLIKQISVSAKMAKEAGHILHLTVKVIALIPVFAAVKKKK